MMKKLLEKHGKKKVYAGIGGATVLVVAIIFGALYMVNENKEVLIVKNDVVKVELGEEVSLKPSVYLSKEMSKENVNSTTLKSELLTDTEKYVVDEKEQTVKSKDKDYLEVGKYKITLSLNKEDKDVTVQVEDTTAPVFKDLKKEIKVEQNAEAVDFTKYFAVEDLSNVMITVNDKKVDLSKTGEYELKVTATDAYDNKTTEKVKIIVIDAAKADEVTETTDGEKPLSAETKQKKEEQVKSEQEQANTGGNTSNGGGNAGGSTNGGSSSNNSGNNSSSGGNNDNSTNNGGTNPTPSAPYIVDDGRSYKYTSTSDIALSMQSPIFNTDAEAQAWAYSVWDNYPAGWGTCGITYSDGTVKYSVYWYN